MQKPKADPSPCTLLLGRSGVSQVRSAVWGPLLLSDGYTLLLVRKVVRQWCAA